MSNTWPDHRPPGLCDRDWIFAENNVFAFRFGFGRVSGAWKNYGSWIHAWVQRDFNAKYQRGQICWHRRQLGADHEGRLP